MARSFVSIKVNEINNKIVNTTHVQSDCTTPGASDGLSPPMASQTPLRMCGSGCKRKEVVASRTGPK